MHIQKVTELLDNVFLAHERHSFANLIHNNSLA